MLASTRQPQYKEVVRPAPDPISQILGRPWSSASSISSANKLGINHLLCGDVKVYGHEQVIDRTILSATEPF